MSKRRKQYSPDFKAKVALAALQNTQTTSEIGARYEIHPTMVTSWKRELIDGAGVVFDKASKSRNQTQATEEELYRQIGMLKVKRDFLAKKLGH
uniref:Transposase n=1 Tax=Candidatus Kentrum eta TaxID=2126337 RepID=A0A450VAD3_9GAMM|nr:MAG: transposase [Candidatus Kentron sp. H]VFK02160.1 MAG: transposase [Candidatus Kentron sp. H]VFK05334.1 MAG: transposase [Candidatus Kentron sp. H]